MLERFFERLLERFLERLLERLLERISERFSCEPSTAVDRRQLKPYEEWSPKKAPPTFRMFRHCRHFLRIQTCVITSALSNYLRILKCGKEKHRGSATHWQPPHETL